MQGSYEILISKLDQFIRKYYLNQVVRGVLLFAAVVAGYYLVASLSEYTMYFPGGVRKAILAGFVLTGLTTLYLLIIKPLLGYWRLGKTISHQQAAQVIGQHFGNVEDKLLNVLQLKAVAYPGVSPALLEAGINQKIESIRLIPFTSAIDLGENKRYLKYAVPPVLIILGILLLSPGVLVDSTTRIFNPNVNFPRVAPFNFELKTKTLKVVQFEDLIVDMKVTGKALPANVDVEIDGQTYKMEKDGAEFSHRFTNVQGPFTFQFVANGFYSQPYKVKVVHKPLITDFRIRLDYPGYTGKSDETISNTGDLFVPAGTVVSWAFSASHTNSVDLRFAGNKASTSATGKNTFGITRRLMHDVPYTIIVKNKEFPKGDSVGFNIVVTPDRAPAIRVEQLGDSINKSYQFFVGDIADDYGFTRLNLVARVADEKGKEKQVKRTAIPIKANTSITDFNYSLNTAGVELNAGETMEYYFEVWDNDGVNGPKSARSQTFTITKPTEKQFEQLEEQNNEQIKDEMARAQKKMKQLAARITELKERVVSKKNFSWEDKKAFDDMLKEQAQLKEQLEKMQQKFEENIARQDEFKEVDPDILEKQQKLEEMMKDLMSEDMQRLMDEINKLLEDLRQKNALEQLENMEMSNERVTQELDKMMELFKQLEFQQKVFETAEQLDELAKEEEKLSEESKQQSKDNNELLQKQEQLNKEFDDLKEKLDKAQELNKELGDPADLDKPQDMSDDVKQDMNNSSQDLQQGQPQKASPKQKNASEKMKQMAKDMRQSMQDMMAQEGAEDMENMRQLLENLVELSFDQEKLMDEIKKTETDNPKYVKLIQQQYKLQDDMKMIDDSLQSLAKRQFQLQKFITDEAFKIRRELKKTLDYMEARNRSAATGSQQYVMTSANNLALMLSESLQQMQMQMRQAMSKPGSGQCKNPGPQGPSLEEMQKKLGEQLRQAQDMMKQGKDPRKMSKEFAEMAAQQAAIREALRKLKEQMSQEQKDKGKVDNLMQQMDNLERDIANKKLTEEMLRRNNDIETRLLELEKAQREQGEDQERKSNTAQDLPPKIPAALEEYLRKRKNEMDVYKTVPPSLKPFYKNLVERYYKSLN